MRIVRIVRIDGIAEFPDSRPSVPAEYLPLRALGEEVLYSFAQEGAANAAAARNDIRVVAQIAQTWPDAPQLYVPGALRRKRRAAASEPE